jgi:hypothetical protein
MDDQKEATPMKTPWVSNNRRTLLGLLSFSLDCLDNDSKDQLL